VPIDDDELKECVSLCPNHFDDVIHRLESSKIVPRAKRRAAMNSGLGAASKAKVAVTKDSDDEAEFM